MRDSYEFEVGGRQYKATPMEARTQQHVARRVQPILISIIPSLKTIAPMFNAAIAAKKAAMAKAEGAESAPTLDDISGGLNMADLLSLDLSAVTSALNGPLDLLAQMSDETFDYIQSKCLSRVQRQKANDTGWVAIWSAQADKLLFEDIEGHEVQLIMLQVLIRELGPFFFGLVSSFKAPGQS